jgi:hypothetical protein
MKTSKKTAFFAISLLALSVILAGCAGAPAASGSQETGPLGMDLDTAVKEAAAQMETKLPAKTMVALVSVMSPSTAFSEQAITRLESAIVSSGKLVVVDRANLDKIRAEQGFQLSDEVDDNSAKSIGKLLGAGAIVTGSLTDLGDVYSLTLKAINIETATVAVSYLADLAKTTRIETLLASGGGTVSPAYGTSQAAPAQSAASQTSVQTTPAQAAAPVAPQSPVYKVGDTGPAGGIVFFDMGFTVDGWRYLEAAPQDFPGGLQWGTNGENVGGTQTSLGSGKRNTELIISALKSSGETVKAAQVANAANYNDYNDWFLPSKDELDLLYKNLKQKGLGNFQNNIYWSSSEQNNAWNWTALPWFQDFRDGGQRYSGLPSGKNDTYLVRAIRQF